MALSFMRWAGEREMFIIMYILIAAGAGVMVYFGYLQGTSRFYMTLFSAAIVLYCLYLDFKTRMEKKAEEERNAQIKSGKKKSKNNMNASGHGKRQPKLTSASKIKGGQSISIRDAAHKATKDKNIRK